MMDDRSAAQTIHGLNIFRMALVVMLPLSALLTPKDPSVYLSKWGIAAVILYILGCLSIFYGDFLRAKWKLFDNDYIKGTATRSYRKPLFVSYLKSYRRHF